MRSGEPQIDYGWQKAWNPSHDLLIPVILRAMNDFGIAKNSLILDAGCGAGQVMHSLSEEGFRSIYGFDLSESGISIAKKTFERMQDRVEVHDAYVKVLPDTFPQNGYDLILSAEVIEHLAYPRAYIENMHHWLNERGLLIMTTPYHGYLKNLAIALFNKFDSHVKPLSEGGHIKFFSKTTLSSLLRETGFKPIRFYGCGRLSYLWKSMLVVAQKI